MLRRSLLVRQVEYGTLIGSSFNYAKEGLTSRMNRWIIFSVLLLPLGVSMLLGQLGFSEPTIMFVLGIVMLVFTLFLMGYEMEIWRGKDPLPDFENWGKLFVDGLKLVVTVIIYLIPLILIVLVFGGMAILALVQDAAFMADPNYWVTNQDQLMTLVGGLAIGILLAIIVGIIILLFATIGVIRMARTERIGEAFNFGGILTTIRGIGWGSYILSLILLAIIMVALSLLISILGTIPFVGWIIYVVFMPFVMILEARYLAQVYNAGEAGKQPVVTPPATPPAT